MEIEYCHRMAGRRPVININIAQRSTRIGECNIYHVACLIRPAKTAFAFVFMKYQKDDGKRTLD